MRSGLEFTENELEEKVKNLEQRCENMDKELQEFHNILVDLEYAYNKLADLEDRSRRCNLWIDGVTERKGETCEQFENKVPNIFKEKLGFENTDIERAHRSKAKVSSNKPRTSVCMLLSYKHKKEILKNVKKLRGSNFFINENFCLETMHRRKELWEEVKRLRNEGQITFLNYRSSGRRDSGD